MKKDIHPTYNITKVSCACGASFVTRSTLPEIKLDICSACHPFFTGRQRLLDTAGRVDRFNKRFASTQGKTIRKKAVAAKPTKTTTTKAKTLSTTPKKTAAAAAKPAKGKKADKAKTESKS